MEGTDHDSGPHLLADYPEEIKKFLEDLKAKRYWRWVNVAFILAALFIAVPIEFGIVVLPYALGFDLEIVILDILLALAGLFLAAVLFYATDKTFEGERMLLVMLADADTNGFAGLARLISESDSNIEIRFNEMMKKIAESQAMTEMQIMKSEAEFRTIVEGRLTSMESQIRKLHVST